jgi:hypothetical protein
LGPPEAGAGLMTNAHATARRLNESRRFGFEFWCVELRAVMNSPDQYTLMRAVEDARRKYIEPGRPRDAARTVERLLAVLDRNDVIHALDRIKRRRVIRLVE